MAITDELIIRMIKVRKKAKIRNQNNQVPHPLDAWDRQHHLILAFPEPSTFLFGYQVIISASFSWPLKYGILPLVTGKNLLLHDLLMEYTKT